MTLSDRLSKTDRRQDSLTPLVERRDGEAARQPRWLRIQQERIAARERVGGSRYDAIADLTDRVAL